MNWLSWIFSGFIATLALSAMLATSQGLGLTRMNVPYMLGTVVTADRERARLYGFIAHILNGWAFSILYVLIFEDLHMVSWWFGMLIGLAHALFVLTVGMMLRPSIGAPRLYGTQLWIPNAAFHLLVPRCLWGHTWIALSFTLRQPRLCRFHPNRQDNPNEPSATAHATRPVDLARLHPPRLDHQRPAATAD
jgi:hypothetical protein